MTKHEAMLEFLRTSPLFSNIAFQFGKVENDAVIFNTETNDAELSRDILGRKTKRYTFSIVTYRASNTDAESDLNIDTLNTVDEFMRWIDEQNKARHFPQFENCVVKEIENLQSTPSVAGTDSQAGLVKYMCQMRVTYTTDE